MKALSLWEPWASLMRTGAKTIETRSWWTHHRGDLLICAARRRDRASLEELELSPGFQRGLASLLPSHQRGTGVLVDEYHLFFGHAVAVVELYECLPTSNLLEENRHLDLVPPELGHVFRTIQTEREFGDYSPHRYAWLTRKLRVIDPFPVRGAQGLFEVELAADALRNGTTSAGFASSIPPTR